MMLSRPGDEATCYLGHGIDYFCFSKCLII